MPKSQIKSLASCVAVADDVDPCDTATLPRHAIYQMQLLLKVVAEHGTQFHMQFGKDNCKLLIAGRTNKCKEVKNILTEEPGLLTFYDSPVTIVNTYLCSYWCALSRTEPIKSNGGLHDVTKNAVFGISPLSNRKLFLSYH